MRVVSLVRNGTLLDSPNRSTGGFDETTSKHRLLKFGNSEGAIFRGVGANKIEVELVLARNAMSCFVPLLGRTQ